MDKAELIRSLMATFVVELQDQLRVYNRELLALERQPAGEGAAASISVLFRTVHSLKGAARAVEALRLARACHALEELLSQLRDERRDVTAELVALLFRAGDVLEASGRRLSAAPEQPGAADDASLDELVAQLTAAKQSHPSPAQAAAPAAAPAFSGAGRSAQGAPEPPLSSRPPARESPPPRTSRPPSADSDVVVRVSTRRLDSLLAQAAELAVARRRLEIRRDQLEALHDSVAHVRSTFRGLSGARRKSLRSQRVAGSGGAIGLTALPALDKPARLLAQGEAALERIETELGRVSLALRADVSNLERAGAPLEAQVRRAGMLRFAEACEGLSRSARDLSQAQQKSVALELHGVDVELDRGIVDSARVALMHLVRNAIDHGIEPPQERTRLGKPPRARISISAAVSGEQIQIEVQDDGRGLDLEALRAQAERRGLHAPDDERALLRLSFAPGFSTAERVTELSGRGVGLDVVQSLAQELGGEIDVRSAPQRGATFTMRVPATAMSLRALLVNLGDQVFALPSRNLQRLLRLSPSEIAHAQGREVITLGEGAPILLAKLRDVLEHTPGRAAEPQEPDASGKLAVVVVCAESRTAALVVDGWLSEQELIQKPLGRRVRKLRKVSGAALLPTGQIALVLRPSELVQRCYARSGLAPVVPPSAASVAEPRKRVLLVDDSVTTRTLERSILEAAGYEVLCAADGQQALSLLREHGADVVVSDVEMPNMDGFRLTEAIRDSVRFRNLPIVLLTALGSEADKARGMQAGADAYLVKRAFDQQLLLKTLSQLT